MRSMSMQRPRDDTFVTAVPAPRWLVIALVTTAFAALFALGVSPRTALFWYIFPLFGIGACYLVEFRSELPRQ